MLEAFSPQEPACLPLQREGGVAGPRSVGSGCCCWPAAGRPTQAELQEAHPSGPGTATLDQSQQAGLRWLWQGDHTSHLANFPGFSGPLPSLSLGVLIYKIKMIIAHCPPTCIHAHVHGYCDLFKGSAPMWPLPYPKNAACVR